MNLREDTFQVGLITGILVPVLAYGLWTLFFSTLTTLEIMDPVGFSPSWRARTLALLAVCSNLIPFNLHKKAHHDNAMRGMVFPTVILVGIWIYMFQDVIFKV
ncbi:MAG: hypothetical protein ACI8YQ_000663 [Polaribacter sp.]|jgi:hypothetical protein